jgi:hypothetical protein
MGKACRAHMGKMRNIHKILFGKHEGKIPLRTSRLQEGNIKMDLVHTHKLNMFVYHNN